MISDKAHEKMVAGQIGGSVVPASGAFWHSKGDARSDRYLVESKRTDKQSFSIKKQIWEKIRREALLDGRIPLLHLQIQGRVLIVLDLEDFLALDASCSEPTRDLGTRELP